MNISINQKLIERNFYFIIQRLSQKAIDCPNFTGTGLVLYNPDIFDHRHHTDLRPSIKLSYEVSLLDLEKSVDVLLKISDKSHQMHDGFHFFNGRTGVLDYFSQYFVPPIVLELPINEDYGTRYHSAIYGSCLDGVILTGAINHDNRSYIFRKGNLVNDKDLIY